jgi:hypothetical protein
MKMPKAVMIIGMAAIFALRFLRHGDLGFTLLELERSMSTPIWQLLTLLP